jgi:hypothetical protein
MHRHGCVTEPESDSGVTVSVAEFGDSGSFAFLHGFAFSVGVGDSDGPAWLSPCATVDLGPAGAYRAAVSDAAAGSSPDCVAVCDCSSVTLHATWEQPPMAAPTLGF